MKNKLILLLTVFCLTSIFSNAQEKPLKLKGVIMENDYHEKITWIKSKPIPLDEKDFTVSTYDVSYIQLYFGLYMKDGKQQITPIHIVNSYNQTKWIFFDEISYLLGSRKEVRAGKGISFKLYDKDTNTNVDGRVTEKSDVLINDEIKKFIKYIIEKPVTRMEIRYKNNRESKVFDLKVNKGTKLLKKHFTTFINAYNQVVDKLKVGYKF